MSLIKEKDTKLLGSQRAIHKMNLKKAKKNK